MPRNRGDQFLRFLAGAIQGGLSGYQLVRAMRADEEERTARAGQRTFEREHAGKELALQERELTQAGETARAERTDRRSSALDRSAADQADVFAGAGVYSNIDWLRQNMGQAGAQDVDLGSIGLGVPVSLQPARDTAKRDMADFFADVDAAGTLQPGERRDLEGRGFVYRKPEPSVEAAGLRRGGAGSAFFKALMNNPARMRVMQAFGNSDPEFKRVWDAAQQEATGTQAGVGVDPATEPDTPQQGEDARAYARRLIQAGVDPARASSLVDKHFPQQ